MLRIFSLNGSLSKLMSGSSFGDGDCGPHQRPQGLVLNKFPPEVKEIMAGMIKGQHTDTHPSLRPVALLFTSRLPAECGEAK